MNVGPVVLRVFSLLQKSKKFQISQEDLARSEELKEKYSKKRFTLALLLIFFLVSFVCTCYLSYQLLAWCRQSYKSAEHMLIISSDSLLITSFFLGMCFAILITLLVTKLILGKDFKDYMLYENIKAGFNVMPFLNVLASSTIFISLLLIYFALDWYAIFDKDKIITNRFFSLQDVNYDYKDITSITYVRYTKGEKNRLKESPYIILEFNDKTTWDSKILDPKDGNINSLVTFIAKTSKKEIKRIDFENK